MPQPAATQFSGIFVSYRREDSSGHAGRLFDNLVDHFGKDRIFMDIDAIEAGEDFVEVIERAVSSCDILIAIIGQRWLRSQKETGNWFDNPNDFVRLEISSALNRDILVIPVLVEKANMPKPQELPEDLKRLCRRNAVELSDLRWQHDVDQLIGVMKKVLIKQDEAAEDRRREEEERARRGAVERARKEAEAREPPRQEVDEVEHRSAAKKTNGNKEHPRKFSLAPGLWSVIGAALLLVIVGISLTIWWKGRLVGEYRDKPRQESAKISIPGVPDGVSIDLPANVQNSRRLPRDLSLVVAIPAADRFYVGGQAVTKEQLANEISRSAISQSDQRVIYIAADQKLDYGIITDLVGVIRKERIPAIDLLVGRRSADDSEAPNALAVTAAVLPDDTRLASPPRKPNPLVLVVSIGGDMQLKLNLDSIGSVTDTTQLGARLAQIFAERTKQHAYKPGMETATNVNEEDRIEKTVIIKAPRSSKYADVIRVIDALRGSGANPVELEIDALPQ